jgi:hypothetical protein
MPNCVWKVLIGCVAVVRRGHGTTGKVSDKIIPSLGSVDAWFSRNHRLLTNYSVTNLLTRYIREAVLASKSCLPPFTALEEDKCQTFRPRGNTGITYNRFQNMIPYYAYALTIQCTYTDKLGTKQHADYRYRIDTKLE